jgi:hypothetical protein
VAAAGIAAALLLLGPLVGRRRPLIAALVVAGAIAMLGAPAAFALQTASTAHTGSTPTAGPAVAGGGGFGGGGPGARSGSAPAFGGTSAGAPPSGTPPTGSTGSALPQMTRGGGGGTTTSAALVELLQADTTHTWVAAAIGSQSAAPLELATGRSIIAIGGFSGSDPAPTLAQFEAMVAKGQIHYLIASGGGNGPGGGRGGSSAITTWVSAHFKATTVGGQTIYDLTKAAS